MKSINIKKIRRLVLCLLIPLVAGFLGSLATGPAITTWYATLNKPNFTPPNWLFGPVWTILFILMGVALFLIIDQSKKKKRRQALIIFGVQLVANVLWSLIFFSGHWLWLAFLEIVILWLLILGTIYSFYALNKKAGWLLIPYLYWVSFAAVLTYSILLLN